MPNATGEHGGTAIDTHWSYVLEAHIAWSASGANIAHVRGDLAKSQIEYDMGSIGGYQFTRGSHSPKGGAVNPKSGWASWPVSNIPNSVTTDDELRDAILDCLSDVKTQVQGLCGATTTSNVFVPRHTGAHSDVIYIDGNNIITFGAKHNVGSGASRQISMSDSAKSFLAHTNLPVATVLSSRYAAWITSATGASKPSGWTASRGGNKGNILPKHQNALFDPRIFIHAFMQKGTLYNTFCDYLDARSQLCNGILIKSENQSTKDTTGHCNVGGTQTLADMAGVNKQSVVARAAKPFGQRGGNTVYIEEYLQNGQKAIRFKLNFRQDRSARPSTIVAHAEKPAGLQNISETEYRNLMQILLEEEDLEQMDAEAGGGDELDATSPIGDSEEEIAIVADTPFEELVDAVDPDGIDGAESPAGDEGAISETRWLKLAGLLQG